MGTEGLVFVFLIVSAVGFMTAVITLRHKRAVLRHEERMTVIEKGGVLPALDEERPKAPWTPRVYLLRGMLWTFVGVAMVIVLASISITAAHPPSLSWRLSEAQALRSQGATEEQLRQFMADEAKRNDGLPIGAASVGLIPIGVGLAYLLFYRKETQSPLGEPDRRVERDS
jgi:Na+-transporting methylmalonyl-CoA/oxaloacetate decarboxylase gamma subunit